MRLLRWIIVVGVVGFLAFAVRDTNHGGYFDMPELADNQYPISFKSGFRAVVTVEDMRENRWVLPQAFRRLSFVYSDRRFFGLPFDNEPWMKDVWSECEYLTEQKAVEYRAFFADSLPAAMQD
jgi:hypothetical protein